MKRSEIINTPILKIHWERFQAHVDLTVATVAQLMAPFTHDAIDQLFLLSEGCANTNYKVTFKTGRSPVVIRIYVRENEALRREVDIHKLVADKIPVAKYFYADDQCSIYSYPYAIVEWVEGTLMREIILTHDEKAMSECCFDAGKYLSELRQIKFSQGGFFAEDLQIKPFSKEEGYLFFVLELLQDLVVKESLGAELHQAIVYLVKTYSSLLPDENEANLAHCDYDPANIIVKQINSKWKIVAVLDWEFAMAGTYLLDIGTMLRYSHQLPHCYENSFIAGIKDHGMLLPPDWKKQAKLMDLLCLLQLAHHNPLSARPKTNRDVVSLMADTVNNWEDY